jgi:hypothetical protein
MQYEPVTPPATEDGETTFTQQLPARLIHTFTHGIHTLCLNDLTLHHLAAFVTLCLSVLMARWWVLARPYGAAGRLKKRE